MLNAVLNYATQVVLYSRSFDDRNYRLWNTRDVKIYIKDDTIIDNHIEQNVIFFFVGSIIRINPSRNDEDFSRLNADIKAALDDYLETGFSFVSYTK